MNLNTKEPSEFGEIELSLLVAPVSQQASSAAKQKFIAEVRKMTKPLEYILNGEVQIEIQWFIHERLRWETDASPDVDNILKPLLDGLCGHEGILIDDCQVQSVIVSWVDWSLNDQKLDIRIRFSPDEYLSKTGLSFVRIKEALCYPIPLSIREKGLQIWLDAIEGATQASEKIAGLTENYYAAHSILPRGLIHRSRIKNFPVHDMDGLRKLK